MVETTEHRVAKAGYPAGTAGRVRGERVERERLERRSPYRQGGAGSFD
jgi:ribosome modulation factor